MKKKFFPFVLFALCLTSAMFSCQGDEAEIPSQSKVDLLMAKSKEFAKKYGVDVSLNRNYVEKHVDEMTVETIEADYRGFAEMKANSPKQNMNAQAFVPTKKLSKKSFIRRRKVETETITPDMFDREGEIKSSNMSTSMCCGYQVHYSVEAEWKSSNGAIVVSIKSIRLHCTNSTCNKRWCKCESESTNRVDFLAQGMIVDGNAAFSGSCSVGSMTLCKYTFKSVAVYVVYNDEAGGGDIQVSLF